MLDETSAFSRLTVRDIDSETRCEGEGSGDVLVDRAADVEAEDRDGPAVIVACDELLLVRA